MRAVPGSNRHELAVGENEKGSYLQEIRDSCVPPGVGVLQPARVVTQTGCIKCCVLECALIKLLGKIPTTLLKRKGLANNLRSLKGTRG